MHEMAIAQSLLAIITEEMEKHRLTKLEKVHVVYGRLASIVPESLEFAFLACTMGTAFEGVSVHLEELPVILECSGCGKTFTPHESNLFMPCPGCEEGLGHKILQGKELYLDNIEAE